MKSDRILCIIFICAVTMFISIDGMEQNLNLVASRSKRFATQNPIDQRIRKIVSNTEWDEPIKIHLLELLSWNYPVETKYEDALQTFGKDRPTWQVFTGEKPTPNLSNTSLKIPTIADSDLNKAISTTTQKLHKTRIENFDFRIKRDNNKISEKLQEIAKHPERKDTAQQGINRLVEQQLKTLNLKMQENSDIEILKKDAQLLESLKTHIPATNTQLLQKLEKALQSRKEIIEPKKIETVEVEEIKPTSTEERTIESTTPELTAKSITESSVLSQQPEPQSPRKEQASLDKREKITKATENKQPELLPEKKYIFKPNQEDLKLQFAPTVEDIKPASVQPQQSLTNITPPFQQKNESGWTWSAFVAVMKKLISSFKLYP